MKIAPLVDVKARLSAYLDDCKNNGPVVITRNGKAVAMLIAPRDDDDLLSLMLAHSPQFQSMLEQSQKSIDEGRGLSEEEFWKIAEQRARQREATARKRPARRKT